jgi:hypothetical protein
MRLHWLFAAIFCCTNLFACGKPPGPNQAAGADCNIALDNNACVAAHYCARADTDRAEQQRRSSGGFLGLQESVPIGRCVRRPAVGEGCTFVNRDCVAGATCQFEGTSRAGICRANP